MSGRRRGGAAFRTAGYSSPTAARAGTVFLTPPQSVLISRRHLKERLSDEIMSLKERITGDMTAAMKARDAGRLSTLRMVKAAVQNREIEKGGELSDEELTRALQSLVKQRRDSVEQYEKAGRAELAEKERAEIAVIEEYLPRAASSEEIERAVEEAVAETGAASMKEMGAVMKAALARLAGRNADGKAVSEAVKKRLA